MIRVPPAFLLTQPFVPATVCLGSRVHTELRHLFIGVFSEDIACWRLQTKTYCNSVCFQTQEGSLVLQSLSHPRWLGKVHLWTGIFPALDYCEQRGCCVCVPTRVRMVTG